jgi:hypothetical protein
LSEVRPSHFLGRCSTTWAMPPALFVLFILEIGPHFSPRPAWTTTLSLPRSLGWQVYATCSAIGWTISLGWPWIVISSISASQVARISWCELAPFFFFFSWPEEFLNYMCV